MWVRIAKLMSIGLAFAEGNPADRARNVWNNHILFTFTFVGTNGGNPL